MKKLISCVLVLAMVLSLGVVAWADTPADRVGYYELEELVLEGEDLTEQVKAAGTIVTLTLNADGTGTLVSGTETMNLTWDETNFYDEEGLELPYTFEDGIISLEEDETRFTFRKTEKAAAAEASDIADTWLGTMDILQMIVAMDPDLGNYLEKAPVNLTMELRADGTYTMEMDGAPILPELRAAMYAYVDQLCEENGVTVAQFEEAQGESLEDIIEEALEDMDLASLNQTIEGVYELSGTELILDKGAEETRGTYTGDAISFTLEGLGEAVFTRAGIFGIWTAYIDVEDAMGDQMEGMEEYFEDVQMEVLLELRSDNSFTLSMDGSAMVPAMTLAVRAYLEEYLEEAGISIDALESMTGQSFDEMLDEALASMDADELYHSMSGTYELKDGELTLKAEGENAQVAKLNGNTITFDVDDLGELVFTHTSNEDVLAKGEGVMSYQEFADAQVDDEVVIEGYLQAKQAYSEEYGNTSLYLQDGAGAYFVYRLACTKDEYETLEIGRKLKITGYKSEWSGEVEITDASFELERGEYFFRAEDVTELLGTDELIEKQNLLVSIKGATVVESEGGAAWLYGWDGSGDEGSDLYFNVDIGGKTYSFVVESDLCGPGTEVYEKVKTLAVGDTVNLTGFLYWYEGPNPHIISVKSASN